MQSSRISNYLSIQKDQISVSINSPTQMFRLIRKVTVQMTMMPTSIFLKAEEIERDDN